jgi:hypothetical protein
MPLFVVFNKYINLSFVLYMLYNCMGECKLRFKACLAASVYMHL